LLDMKSAVRLAGWKNEICLQETMVNTVQNDADDALSGVINGFTVGAFLQLLELEQKTCCLKVQFQDMCGTVYVHRGVVLDAEVDTMNGEEAAIFILSWDNATIRVENNCERKTKNIKSSLTRLLLDGLKRKDEAAAANASQNELKSAISLVEGHHFQEAHRRLTAYLKAHPEDGNAWLWYSRCLGDVETIGAALKKGLKVTDDDRLIKEEIKKIERTNRRYGRIANMRRCPFCWSPLERKAKRCHYCCGRLALADALSHDDLNALDSNSFIDSVTRYTNVIARENNVNAYYFLSLANCNLKKTEEALDLLNEALRNYPDNKFIKQQLNIVLDHLAKRLTKYETIKAESEKKPKESDTPVAAEKKKILVVQNSPTTRKVVVLTLKQEGFHMIEAQDGLEALSKIDEERPDLVLLDTVLPMMDGYKVLSIIKENKKFKDIPVIMLTSKGGLLDKFKGKLAGSAAYLTKPFEPKDLIRTVQKHIAG
jgi:twitching motility two-component system response regulator PilG